MNKENKRILIWNIVLLVILSIKFIFFNTFADNNLHPGALFGVMFGIGAMIIAFKVVKHIKNHIQTKGRTIDSSIYTILRWNVYFLILIVVRELFILADKCLN